MRRCPPLRRRSSAGPSPLSVASTTRSPTISRNTRRAVAVTVRGARSEAAEPSPIAAASAGGRKSLRPADRRFNAALATSRSAGRTTSSTNRVVNVRPSGSARMRDRSLADCGVGSWADSSAQRRARMIALSPSAHRSSGQRRALESGWGGVGTATFVMRRPPGVDERRILRVTCSDIAWHARQNSRHRKVCWLVHANPSQGSPWHQRMTIIRATRDLSPNSRKTAANPHHLCRFSQHGVSCTEAPPASFTKE